MARAAHELRGAGHGDRARRRGAAARAGWRCGRRWRLESQLDRLAAGLADLDAARCGRTAGRGPAALPARARRAQHRRRLAARGALGGPAPALSLGWRARGGVGRSRAAGPGARQPGVATRMEHGSGPVEVSGRRAGRRALVEVRDGGPAAGDRRRGATAGAACGSPPRPSRRPAGRLERGAHARGHAWPRWSCRWPSRERAASAAGAAFLMLALALACGGLAASEVSSRVREVEAAVGEPVPVLVAARDVAPGAELRPGRPGGARGARAVRAAGRDVARPRRPSGRRWRRGWSRAATSPSASLGAGGGRRPRGGPGPLRRGERALEVAVAGGESLAGVAGPGSRVDVLVSTDPGEGAGRTLLALESVELLDLTRGGAAQARSSATRRRRGRRGRRRRRLLGRHAAGDRAARRSTSPRLRTSRARCACCRGRPGTGARAGRAAVAAGGPVAVRPPTATSPRERERRHQLDPVAAPEPARVVPAGRALARAARPCAGRWWPPARRSRSSPATTTGGGQRPVEPLAPEARDGREGAAVEALDHLHQPVLVLALDRRPRADGSRPAGRSARATWPRRRRACAAARRAGAPRSTRPGGTGPARRARAAAAGRRCATTIPTWFTGLLVTVWIARSASERPRNSHRSPVAAASSASASGSAWSPSRA